MASPYIILTVLILASSRTFAELVPGTKTSYYILEPHKLRLECTFTNLDADITWTKNGQALVLGDGYHVESTEDKAKKTSTLTKASTSDGDTGEYSCTDGNETLKFTVKIFKVIAHDITIVSKEPALIKCDLQNLDKSLVQKFYWMKNHTMVAEVSELKDRYQEYEGNYTLEIPKAKRRDNGLYNCVFKIDEQDFSIDVHMNMAPWIESMEKSRNLVQGDKLHLECKVQSHPYAMVSWKKDNETFKKEANRVFLDNNRTLIIYDLQFSDRGDYTCVATNNVNSTSMTVLVRVKDKLAALWPFLGIVAEVVILCIIIFICEKRRSKEMEDEYENAGPQSMPNAKDHKGKDEIRQRNVRT